MEINVGYIQAQLRCGTFFQESSFRIALTKESVRVGEGLTHTCTDHSRNMKNSQLRIELAKLRVGSDGTCQVTSFLTKHRCKNAASKSGEHASRGFRLWSEKVD